MARGRKSKFNEEIASQLITAHENGLPMNSCASLVGINRTTLYRWIEKGKNAKSGKFKKFYGDWLKAETKFELYHLKKINDAKDWRASQYLLSVKNPDVYNTQNWHKVDANVKSDVKLNLNNLFDDDFIDEVLNDAEDEKNSE